VKPTKSATKGRKSSGVFGKDVKSRVNTEPVFEREIRKKEMGLVAN